MELATPYTGYLPSSLIGQLIRIKCQPHQNARCMAINLQCGPQTNPRDDIALHLSPVFTPPTRVVRNTLEYQKWGPEESHGGFPFMAGQECEILILIESDHFKIAINGMHFAEFRFRIPINRASHICIDGDVTIRSINYETNPAGSSAPPMTSAPPMGSAPPMMGGMPGAACPYPTDSSMMPPYPPDAGGVPYAAGPFSAAPGFGAPGTAAYPPQSGPYPSQSGPYPSQSGPYAPQPAAPFSTVAVPGPYLSQPTGPYPQQPRSPYSQRAATGYPGQAGGYPAMAGGYPVQAGGYPMHVGPGPSGAYPHHKPRTSSMPIPIGGAAAGLVAGVGAAALGHAMLGHHKHKKMKLKKLYKHKHMKPKLFKHKMHFGKWKHKGWSSSSSSEEE